MRIVCPGCATEYEVPGSRMTPRRTVRCARCGGEWAPASEAEEPPSPPGPAIAWTDEEAAPSIEPDSFSSMTAMDRLAAPAPRPSTPVGLRLAWIVTFVILAAAGVGVFVLRESVSRVWPPAARVLGSPAQPTPAAILLPAKPPEPSHAVKE
jgi:predicted Zn finger-like uncharacterized protein